MASLAFVRFFVANRGDRPPSNHCAAVKMFGGERAGILLSLVTLVTTTIQNIARISDRVFLMKIGAAELLVLLEVVLPKVTLLR